MCVVYGCMGVCVCVGVSVNGPVCLCVWWYTGMCVPVSLGVSVVVFCIL